MINSFSCSLGEKSTLLCVMCLCIKGANNFREHYYTDNCVLPVLLGLAPEPLKHSDQDKAVNKDERMNGWMDGHNSYGYCNYNQNCESK